MANFWFKFEWDAWRDDRQLRRCSKETRGFWIDCIAEMEKHNTYFLEGTPDEIGRDVGANQGEVDRSLAELTRTGAANITEYQGVVKIMSRRLLKKHDLTEYNRIKQQECRERKVSSECQDLPSKDIEIKSFRALDSPIGEVCAQPAKAEPKVLLPIDFRPTEEMFSWCKVECPGVDPLTELQEFIDFWRDIATKNHKRTLRGWNATWKNRMREIQKRNGSTKTFPERRTNLTVLNESEAYFREKYGTETDSGRGDGDIHVN